MTDRTAAGRSVCIRKHRRAIGTIAAAVLLLSVLAAWVYGRVTGGIPEGQAYFYFFDVGQADAAAVITRDGCILIDAGSNISEDRLCFTLEKAGVKRIDLAVLSHPHEDHIGGADVLLENFEVTEIIMPSYGSDELTYRRLCNAAERSGAATVTAYEGLCRAVGGMSVTVLSVFSESSDENDASTVIRVSFGDTSAIFTGDAGVATEQKIIKKYPADTLGCDILKVGHHGSPSATCDEWATMLHPQYAVVSCARMNDYGHPNYAVLRRLRSAGATICRTDTDGTILLISDGKSVTLNK